MDFCEEPDCIHPDVGVCFYTQVNSTIQVASSARNAFLLFYPKSPVVRVTVATSGWDVPYVNDSTRGAAVSDVWV